MALSFLHVDSDDTNQTRQMLRADLSLHCVVGLVNSHTAAH